MATPPLFDLGGAMTVEPLDMGEVTTPQTPAPVQKDPKAQKREWLKLAMLLPLVMKGGPGALQGFVSGLNQSDVYNQQQSRLDSQEQARVQAQQDVIAQRDRAIEAQTANNLEQRKQDLLKAFIGDLGKTTSDSEVQALLGLYGPQAQGLGIPVGRLAGFAAQTQTPARLRARLITEAWGRLGENAKKTALEQPQFVIPLGDGTVADVSEVAKAVGLPIDPTTGKPPLTVQKPDVPNTPEEQFYQRFATERGAKTFGELPTSVQAQARKQWMQADNDPLLDEMRQMRIEMMRRQVNAPDLSPAQFNMANRLADDFARDSKDFMQRGQSYGTVLAASKDATPAGDLSLIFAFMKMLDPGSVVREGEFATAQNAAAVPDRIRNIYNRVMEGTRLTPEQRADFVKQAKNVYGAAKTRQANVVKTYTERARLSSVPAELVVMDFGAGVESVPAAPPAALPDGPAIDLGGGITVRPVER